jgi:hypothetical protein
MPTTVIPAPPRGDVTITPTEERILTGFLSDVMYTAGRYDELGVVLRSPQPIQCPTPGQVSYRVTVTAGAPLLPIGIDYDRESAVDYLIAAAPVIKYGLIAGVVATAGYGIYSVIHSVVSWFDANGAAVVSGAVTVGVVVALVVLLSVLRGGGKGCAGLHCGGCKG